MKNITLYHGTSIESAVDILKNGFKNTDRIWNVSFPEHMYFWHSDENSDSSYEDVNFVISAGQLAAAHQASKYNDIAVIILKMSEDIFETEFMPDVSCENMENCYQIDTHVLNNLIKTKKINICAKIIRNAYNPNLRYLYMPVNDDRLYYNYPDEDAKEFCKIMKHCEIPSAVYDMTYYSYTTDLDTAEYLKPADYNIRTNINIMQVFNLLSNNINNIRIYMRDNTTSKNWNAYIVNKTDFINYDVKPLIDNGNEINICKINIDNNNCEFYIDDSNNLLYDRLNNYYERITERI